MLPKDPVMLLSFINMKLRDQYDSLESLCEDFNVSKEEIIEKLKTALLSVAFFLIKVLKKYIPKLKIILSHAIIVNI